MSDTMETAKTILIAAAGTLAAIAAWELLIQPMLADDDGGEA